MEEHGNKTIMCSVLFLDIVEYSKKSVTGQISLKDRFNSYLSAAIRDVPMTDRIILDTGDGAAINFLGDVEDALNAALSLRESLLNEKLDVEYPLMVRMGINLGPVCLVRDINGQPNIVGDGINVAQRVMGFAEAVQILVSRSYYDAVSRLSPQYAGMFHYQGSRTDKHVREHEVYAIGYPGDKAIRGQINKPAIANSTENLFSPVIQHAKVVWATASTRLDALVELGITRFGQAGTGQRAMYIGIIALPLALLIALLANRTRHNEIPVLPAVKSEQEVKVDQEGLVVASAPSTDSQITATPAPILTVRPISGAKPKARESIENKIARDKPTQSDIQEKVINKSTIENTGITTSSGGTDAYIAVSCVAGTEVFVDGVRKGRISSAPLSIKVPPGKHAVIISHTSRGIFTQSVELHQGRTMHIKPSLCN
jgi:hypothetical protein